MATANLAELTKLTWNEESKDLESIIAESELPVLVKMSDGNTTVRKDHKFDMHQPMVLYEEVSGVKVYAKNVVAEDTPEVPTYREVGPTVVIPQQYLGKVYTGRASVSSAGGRGIAVVS